MDDLGVFLFSGKLPIVGYVKAPILGLLKIPLSRWLFRNFRLPPFQPHYMPWISPSFASKSTESQHQLDWIAGESGGVMTPSNAPNHHGANMIGLWMLVMDMLDDHNISQAIDLTRFDHGTWSFLSITLLGNGHKTTLRSLKTGWFVWHVFLCWFWGWFVWLLGFSSSQDCLKSASVSPTAWSRYQLCNSDLALIHASRC